MGTAAGGASSGFEADTGHITAAGVTLRGQAGDVASARAYGPLQGLDEGVEVEDAAARFRQMWDDALERWQVSLSLLGDAATSSAAAISRTDADGAAAWSSMLGAGTR